MCVKSVFVIVTGLCDQLALCSCLYKCKQVIKLLFVFFNLFLNSVVCLVVLQSSVKQQRLH